MKYDFESTVNRRGTGSHKWNGMLKSDPNVPDGIIPFSVADMEIKTAPELVQGLKDYIDNSILGYTGATDSYYDAVIGWMQTRHGFAPKAEWIIQTAGVVPALTKMVAAFTQPGDSVLITTPVYYPFYSAITENGCNVVRSELVLKGSHYEIDFEDFEAKAKLPEVKLFILCSPHNPIGRIWTQEELMRIADICLENNVFILDDEIHHDLVMPGYKHVSMGTFEQKYLENCAICTAPSKTFNLAGLQASNIIISNDEMREKLRRFDRHLSLTCISYKACEIAYTQCGGWLDELLGVLDTNRQYIEDFMAANIPEIRVFRLEGTYLQWWDCRGLGLDYQQLEEFMTLKAHLFLDEGYLFGDAGRGFERFNLACPTSEVKAAMERLLAAVKALR